jgi:hypothetical protein
MLILNTQMKSLPFFYYAQVFDIVVDSFDDPKNLTNNWQFALLNLAGSHYAAICTEKDRTTGGESDFSISKIKLFESIAVFLCRVICRQRDPSNEIDSVENHSIC